MAKVIITNGNNASWGTDELPSINCSNIRDIGLCIIVYSTTIHTHPHTPLLLSNAYLYYRCTIPRLDYDKYKWVSVWVLNICDYSWKWYQWIYWRYLLNMGGNVKEVIYCVVELPSEHLVNIYKAMIIGNHLRASDQFCDKTLLCGQKFANHGSHVESN